MFETRSKVLFVSAILGVIYLIFLILSYVGLTIISGGLGAFFALLAIPHMILIILAVLFNILAFFMTSKGFSITAGVLYSVAALFNLIYIIWIVPMIVLSFVGVSKTVEIKSKNHKISTLSI